MLTALMCGMLSGCRSYCDGIDLADSACMPAASIGTLATNGACLSKSEISSALSNIGGVFEALYDRSDLRITIEMQPGGSNTLSTQIYSFLARGHTRTHCTNSVQVDAARACCVLPSYSASAVSL